MCWGSLGRMKQAMANRVGLGCLVLATVWAVGLIAVVGVFLVRQHQLEKASMSSHTGLRPPKSSGGLSSRFRGFAYSGMGGFSSSRFLIRLSRSRWSPSVPGFTTSLVRCKNSETSLSGACISARPLGDCSTT